MLCFGCFDGHGVDGHVIAAACAAQLSSCVLDDQQYYLNQQDFPSAVRGGMESLVRRLQEISPNRADIEYSGATAVIGLVDPSTCTVHLANVGDTRAIGAKRVDNKYALVQLSQEHILSVDEEVLRIEQSGGVVHPLLIDGEFVGPPRCFFNHELATLPGLMVSRTLGDTVARAIGVVAEPDVFCASNLSFLVLASDGLWEVMTNEEVVQFVGQRLGLATRETALSQLLCVEAHKRWLALENQVGDDVSCLVLVFEQST
ncbi:hypothetical protein BASA81_004522 [Batrachochytrium salamandrivorans]|nr:hypothetical protein BASA81_004522 [Batrachochytrium salamandrivorans]